MKRTFITAYILSILTINAFSQITMLKQEDGILVLSEGEKVFFYQSEVKRYGGEYERRHYLHPLWGPDGVVLTEDFPAGNPHHRGVFWTWPRVLIGHKQIGNPWELVEFKQSINDIEFRSQRDGTGILSIGVNWLSDQWLTHGNSTPYLKENTTVVIHPIKKNYRRLDIVIQLQALEKNLLIGGSEDEKGYGGFSIRLKLPDDVKFSGAGGDIDPDISTVASPGYINISGSMGKEGRKAGIVIVDNKKNPGYPQAWVLGKNSSIQNAAFPGNSILPLSFYSPLVLKYSLLVYQGKMNDKKIRRIIEYI